MCAPAYVVPAPEPAPPPAADPRAGLSPGTSSGNDALDRERGKGVYYVDPGAGGGGGGGGTVAAVAPPPAPILPDFKPLVASNFLVKEAPIDTIVFDSEGVPIDEMMRLLYEDIGGVELSNISRYDLIDGQDVIYSPIRNLQEIWRKFNPVNLIAASLSDTYFSRFAIDLVARGINEPQIDGTTGDITITVDNVANDEDIEVQIVLSGTINRVDI